MLIINFFIHYFCLIFGVVRYRYYIVDLDGNMTRIKLNYTPKIIYFKKEEKYMLIENAITEVISDTLVYVYLK